MRQTDVRGPVKFCPFGSGGGVPESFTVTAGLLPNFQNPPQENRYIFSAETSLAPRD